MRITIPENEELFGKGASCLDSFRFMQLWLTIATKDFTSKYPPGQAYDIDCMEANFICEIIKNLNSLYLVCVQNYDFQAGAVLCRSIADKVAVLKLIYAHLNESERTYRYYLYLFDRMRERDTMLKDPMEYNGRISQTEYNALLSQISQAKQNTHESIEFCTTNLDTHPYAEQYPIFHESVLKDAVWQYKELGILGKKGKPSKYKWEDLYALIDNRPSVVAMYSRFLSQFAHGLSIGSLPAQDCNDNFDSLLCVAVCLQGVILEELKSRFHINETIINNITQEEMAAILSFYSDTHINNLYSRMTELYKDQINDNDLEV